MELLEAPVSDWSVSDISNASMRGNIEIGTKNGPVDFVVLQAEDRLVFGGACNAGFLESGYIIVDAPIESFDEALAELYLDLEAYYNEGPSSVSRIVVNARM